MQDVLPDAEAFVQGDRRLVSVIGLHEDDPGAEPARNGLQGLYEPGCDAFAAALGTTARS